MKNLTLIMTGLVLWLTTACGPVVMAQSDSPPSFPATTFGFSQDGNFKAGLWYQTVYVFDLRSGSVTALPPMPDSISPGLLLVFSADNKLLAAEGCSDGTGTFCQNNRILVWDVPGRKLLHDFKAEQIFTVGKMNFTTGNQQLVVEGCVFTDTYCDTLGRVTFDLQSAEPGGFVTFIPEVTPTYLLMLDYSVTAISPDSRLKAAMWLNGNMLFLWNLTNMERLEIEQISMLGLEYNSINRMTFSPDSRWLAANGCVASQSFAKWRTCVESRVFVWDITTRTLRHILDGDPLLNVNELTFSDDSLTLEAKGCLAYESQYAEVCAEGQVGSLRWDIETGEAIRQ